MGIEVSTPSQPVPSVPELDAYLDLSREEIARLVLCLLIQEAVQKQIDALQHAPEASPS